eukprot:2912824-Prorocentrum_lima.AAC.1
MAHACPSIAEYRKAAAQSDSSRQKAEDMSLQHISDEIDTTLPGDNVRDITQEGAGGRNPMRHIPT